MGRREDILTNRGYVYVGGWADRQDARKDAEKMREVGYKATVLEEQNDGKPYYAIWAKRY